MSLDIRPGITIRRPRREVAAVIFDPRYDEAWQETIRPTGAAEPPPGPGVMRARSMRFLLREIALSLRVTGFDPDRFIELSTEEPFPLVIRQDLESIPEGTLVRVRVRAEPRGGLRLLHRIVRLRLRRSVIGDLEALKALVENSPHRGMAAASPAAAPSAHPSPAQRAPAHPIPAQISPAQISPVQTSPVQPSPVPIRPPGKTATPDW